MQSLKSQIVCAAGRHDDEPLPEHAELIAEAMIRVCGEEARETLAHIVARLEDAGAADEARFWAQVYVVILLRNERPRLMH